MCTKSTIGAIDQRNKTPLRARNQMCTPLAPPSLEISDRDRRRSKDRGKYKTFRLKQIFPSPVGSEQYRRQCFAKRSGRKIAALLFLELESPVFARGLRKNVRIKMAAQFFYSVRTRRRQRPPLSTVFRAEIHLQLRHLTRYRIGTGGVGKISEK